ncbi:MAG: hypothetical protein ACFFAO_10470 [Candidatus Hermodarchaeota archaeon]
MITNKTMNGKESQYIKIKKKEAQLFLNLIRKEFKKKLLINHKLKILKEDDYILFPLIDNKLLIERLNYILKEKFHFQIITKKSILNPNYKSRTIRESLKNKIQDEYLDLIPKSYDIIGNIAIIEFLLLKDESAFLLY